MTITNRIEECKFPQIPPVERQDLGIAGAKPQELVAVLQSAQSLTSTIELAELIHQLHQIILQNSGAQICMLALPDRENRWQIHSRSVSGVASIATLSQHLENSIDYPANLICWVKNTQQPMSCNARQPLEIPDRYLQAHQPQSVFALPIVKQDTILGVVYLEHRQAPDLFSDNHKAIISFLCNQAAIAIDNANSYHESLIVAENLRLQQSYLEALLNNIPHMAWIKDEQSRFIAVNRAFTAVSGCEQIDLVGKTDLDIWPEELANAYRHDDFAVMASGERKVVEERILTAADEPRWLETMKMPMRNSEGEMTGTVGIALDITDRKQAERELKLAQLAVESSADGIAWVRQDAAFIYANPSMCRMLGYSLSELQDLHVWDIDDSASPHTWPQHWQRLQANRTFSFESEHHTREGRYYPVEISCNYFEFEGEQYNCFLTRDITDRKQAEIALRESEARYHRLADNIPGIIYQLQMTPDGSLNYPYISSGCWDLFELSPAAVMADANCLFQKLHPEDRPESRRAIVESAQKLAPKTVEGRSILSSGEIKWIKSISRPERQPDGSIVWDGMMFDITDRKQVEMELLASKQFLQTVLDTFPLSVFWKDRQSRYLGCNQQFAIAAGVASAAELIGKNDYELPWDLAETERFRADDAEVIDTETPKLGIIETQLQADGNCCWVETNKVPLRNPNDETIGVLGTFQNVTDREQAQIALRLTNERLELTILELQRATRLKDEFLATMSHELRTPLNAILGMSEALHEQVFGSLNQQQLKSIKTIQRGGRHLLSLITDILDVSKISAGKLELDIGTISIAHLCNSSLAFVRQQALQKQIQLDLQLSPVPGNIAVDERRMRQVAINLLGNAVKFTPPGGRIVLSVSQQQTDERWDWELSVTDTGIGIAPQDLDRLFQPFVQLDSRLNRQYEGTGLGLALVKQIVELHGGNISVRSELDRGSCFTVRVPYVCALSGAGYDLDADPSTGNLRPLDLEPTSAPLILLAEDNAANINTLSSYLNAKGYRTILATTGLEAIHILQEAAKDRPDLILMDIQMPEMDGLEAIDRIRNQLNLTAIPIIALTALAMPDDREKCLAVGANEYLTKPVQLKKLAATIQQLLRVVASE